MQSTRRLAAILFTDIVGSTSMMQKDEQHALSVNKRYVQVLKQSILSRGGEILNDYGDGSLCCFSSAKDAILSAIEMQQQFQLEPRVPLRIGLHVGEIFFEDGKVFGDGVNIASRIQSLGIANSILFSSEINSKIKNQPEFKSVLIGKFNFKNVDELIEVFALNNQGLSVPKKEELIGKLRENKKSNLNRVLVSLSAIILLLSVFFIYKNFWIAKENLVVKTIAVLPFENVGTDNNEEYISDGITQDVISKLSKISSLEKVIAWFSVKRFRNTKRKVKEIAEELGVAAILTGTIESHATNIHIITELIDVQTNKRLWGEDYNYNSKAILSIQSNLTDQIANALRVHLTSEEKRAFTKQNTENIDAYKFYRKGRSFWDQRTQESYDSAEANYKKAIDLDPDFALAYSGLADCYTFNQKGMSQADAIPIARTYANKALSLDSTLTEAQTTLAFIQSHYDFDWVGGIALFKKIINKNPNYPIAHLYYGNILLYTGKPDEGLIETKKALSLDPLSAVINYALGRYYFYSRKYDSAIIQLQKNLTLNPKFRNSNVILGWAYIQKKQYSKALDAFSTLPKVPFDLGCNGSLFLSCTFACSGNFDTAKTLLSKIPQRDFLQSPYYGAQVYISLGNFKEGIRLLERAYNEHAIPMIYLKIDPFLDPVRNEPGFKDILRRMNLE